MASGQEDIVENALSIAEITGREISVLEQLEGEFLVAGGKKDDTSPAEVANSVNLDRSKVIDVFRQLRQSGAIDRTTVGPTSGESRYDIQTPLVRDIFSAARQSIDYIQAFEERSPPESEVQPLVTFPEDPAFEGVSPYDYNMKWLMPSLTSAIKDANNSITIVTPFFDESGFETLQDVLINALRRGVEVTIITRYLSDRDSYNRYVLSRFAARVDDSDAPLSNLTFIDYTVWDSDVPEGEKKQDGENPAFTLHAKVMLFDERVAYIGSANVTDYGFDRYLELGVILRGPPVPDLSKLVTFLKESDAASKVDIAPQHP